MGGKLRTDRMSCWSNVVTRHRRSLGPQIALFVSSLIFTISSLGTALAPSFTSFVLWRIAGEVAIDMASGLSPLYIAEIAPPRSRGVLVCLNQIATVTGILADQIADWMIAPPVRPCKKSRNRGTGWKADAGCSPGPPSRLRVSHRIGTDT